MHVCMYVRMYVCMYVCMHVRMCVHMYVCMYVCMSSICIYVCHMCDMYGSTYHVKLGYASLYVACRSGGGGPSLCKYANVFESMYIHVCVTHTHTLRSMPL
jgi:hypothetical protein